jgi:hypothetical protein
MYVMKNILHLVGIIKGCIILQPMFKEHDSATCEINAGGNSLVCNNRHIIKASLYVVVMDRSF